MREVKFRGKLVIPLHKGFEWIHGQLIYDCAQTRIVTGLSGYTSSMCDCQSHGVYPDTVGQFTDMKDNKKNEAFEGDVLKNGKRNMVICFGEYEQGSTTHVGFYVDFRNQFLNSILRRDVKYWLENSEIIGNIHDNPEMIDTRE